MLPGMSDKLLQDEKELRAFYESVGLSPDVIERAIAAKFKPPAPETRGRWPRNKKRMRAVSAS
jgi:hypothetical protein